MTKRIAAHPVLAFILLAYGFSYLVGAPFEIAVQAWLPRAPALLRDYLARSLVVLGPTVAAVIVTSSTEGRPGLVRLTAAFRMRRRNLAWWPGLPLLGLLLCIGGYLLAGTSPGALGRRMADAWPLYLLHLGLQVLVIGVGEEVGWRGWLLPALLRRHTRVTASALLAVVWGLWHLPVLLSGLQDAAIFLAGVCSLTFLFTALWSQTRGELGLLALAHASFNAPTILFEGAFGSAAARAALHRSIALLVAVTFVLVAMTWRWWLDRAPPAPQPGPAPARAAAP